MAINVKYNYAPQFIQKKKSNSTKPNSYRVFFEEAYFWKPKANNIPLKVPDNYTPVPVKIPDTIYSFQPKRDLRHHNPQPLHCNFLRHNARTLNAPQFYVKSKLENDNEENCWYSYKYPDKPIIVPKYSLDSTSRSDFKNWKSCSLNTRHSSTPRVKHNPVSHNYYETPGSKLWKEEISFENEYNSRDERNYQIRGKRHGAFVITAIDKDLAEMSDQKSLDFCSVSDQNFQHKLAFHRQFATPRYLLGNVDSVSRLLQPIIDDFPNTNQSTPQNFTH